MFTTFRYSSQHPSSAASKLYVLKDANYHSGCNRNDPTAVPKQKRIMLLRFLKVNDLEHLRNTVNTLQSKISTLLDWKVESINTTLTHRKAQYMLIWPISLISDSCQFLIFSCNSLNLRLVLPFANWYWSFSPATKTFPSFLITKEELAELNVDISDDGEEGEYEEGEGEEGRAHYQLDAQSQQIGDVKDSQGA